MTNEPTTTLKHCPFCGGAAKLDAGQALDHTKTGVPMVWTAYVHCEHRCCQQGANGEPDDDRDGVVARATEAWNARAHDPIDLLYKDDQVFLVLRSGGQPDLLIGITALNHVNFGQENSHRLARWIKEQQATYGR